MVTDLTAVSACEQSLVLIEVQSKKQKVTVPNESVVLSLLTASRGDLLSR